MALALMEDQWKQQMLEAIDEGLLILGESSRKSVYFHLQTKYSLMREDVPNKPEVFVECLEKIFGAGAKVVEEAIAKSLCKKLGLTFETKYESFVNCLNEIRRLRKMV